MVDSERFVPRYMEHFISVVDRPDLPRLLAIARGIVVTARDRGSKLIFAGNGASASIASHYALDFTKQAGVRATAFNDAAFITAYGNDYGYEHWVAQAIRHRGRLGDVAVLISSSGRSPNMVNAADAALEMKLDVITFTGFEPDNPVRTRGAVNLWADSRSYNVVESAHATWLGLLCDMIIGKIEYDVADPRQRGGQGAS